MRILVNAVAARQGGGITHLGPFVRGLAIELSDAHIDVYVTKDMHGLPDFDRVTWRLVDVPAGVSFRRLWWDNVEVARFARSYDLVVSPLNYGSVWCPTFHVLFQRNALYFDPEYTKIQPFRTRLVLSAFRWMAIVQSNTADFVIVPTEAMASLLRRYLLDPKKVVVAPHSIDVSRCQELANLPIMKGAELWSQSQFRLLHIGNPANHKGLETLAHTFVEVSRALPGIDVALAICCNDDNNSSPVSEFRTIVEAAGLSNGVNWLGAVPHDAVFALYAAADVLLLPSRVESFGYPILEALAVGCPVVASDLPAFREVSRGKVAMHPVGSHIEAAKLTLNLLRRTPSTDIASEDSLSGGSQNFQAQIVARLTQSQLHKP